ncbi:MAG: hypothetical protein U9Q96_01365 [Patescibacteria group bacterium]|nr:hypothetical protein [Patescibacteria group bacterium]
MIIGHQKQRSFLKKSIENDRVIHAYLFYGPAKIGKKAIALEFIKSLFNSKEESNIVSDLTIIGPEHSTDKKGEIKEAIKAIIPVAKIFDLKTKLSLSAIGDDYKAAIVDEAQAMSRDAQTALLKLLEEPKGKTVIILLAEHLEQLLPTIVSRCQSIRFDLLRSGEIEKYLLQQDLSTKKAQEISWLSFGRPGLAIDYLNGPEKEKFQREKIQRINQLVNSSLKIRFQYAEKLSKKRDETNKTLDLWLNYFRELLLNKFGEKNIPADFQEKSYSIEYLKKIIDLIEKIKLVLSRTNINPRLALEVLLMKI